MTEQPRLVVMRLPGRKGAYLCIHEPGQIMPLARLLDRVSIEEFLVEANHVLQGGQCQVATCIPLS